MMKRIILSIILLATVSIAAFAQAPQGINYQAVIRDNGGNIVSNQPVGVRITILKDLPPVVYIENHSVTTNDRGLINLVIGQGTSINGVFSLIDWSDGPYYAQLEADVTGGTNYEMFGSQQLMSVPYALYAETTGQSGSVGPTGAPGADQDLSHVGKLSFN